MEKNRLIQKIIELEWNMFTNTKNIGTRAVCQDKKGNFVASRASYFDMYDENILFSYEKDLQNAIKNDVNIVSQKYAYMMMYTDIENYNKIKHLLVNISDEKNKIVDAIMLIYMSWEEEIVKKQPSLDNKNRILYSKYDTKNNTSVQTYMSCELKTYSMNTLSLIIQYFLKNLDKKINLVEKYMNNLNGYKNMDYENYSCKINNIQLEKIGLKEARIIVEYAKKISLDIGIPVVITVVDDNSNIIVLEKMDGALLASIDISPAKAKTCIKFKNSTQNLSNQEFSNILNNFQNSSYCFLGGGIPILKDGKIIGGIGISGGSVEQDIKIAEEALKKFVFD